MKKIIIYWSLLFTNFCYSQNVYIDPTTTLALKFYSDNLEKEQEKTIEQQTKLEKAQAWVATQMAYANSVQDKVLKGLNEVSGTLENGLQIKEIYSNVDQCLQYSADVLELAKNKPQYSVFGIQASQKTYEQAVKIVFEASELLKSGELNLATAGDRHRLLFQINHNVEMLKIWILTIKINIESAIRLGFWRAINPFQGYINTDKSIVENIMYKYKHQF